MATVPKWSKIPPDAKWDKKVRKLADEYNDLASKLQKKDDAKLSRKMDETVFKIEEGFRNEKNTKARRDFAFLIQLIEERHKGGVFPADILHMQEQTLGGGSDTALEFKQMGQTEPPSQTQQQFNIETIDLAQVPMINVEKITPDDLEKVTQKCAFGDGEILDEHGRTDGQIWRCKSCGTVYHENCLRVCLLTKGSCLICDAEYLQQQK
jgi:rubrerythrin